MIKYYFKVLTTFSFKGRARRAEYWWFGVFNAMAAFVLDIVGKFWGLSFDMPADEFGPASSESILSLIYSLLTFVQIVAVTVRRFHDVNLSGWWNAVIIIGVLAVVIVWPLVPMPLSIIAVIAIALAAFVVTVIPGTDGANKYGEDPKSVPAEA